MRTGGGRFTPAGLQVPRVLTEASFRRHLTSYRRACSQSVAKFALAGGIAHAPDLRHAPRAVTKPPSITRRRSGPAIWRRVGSSLHICARCCAGRGLPCPGVDQHATGTPRKRDRLPLARRRVGNGRASGGASPSLALAARVGSRREHGQCPRHWPCLASGGRLRSSQHSSPLVGCVDAAASGQTTISLLQHEGGAGLRGSRSAGGQCHNGSSGCRGADVLPRPEFLL